MKAPANIIRCFLPVLIFGLTSATLEAQDLRVDVRFTDPVDNSSLSKVPTDFPDPAGSPIPLSVLDLPPEVNAEFFLSGGRTSDSGTTTYVTSDIQRASVPFRDAQYTVMRAFNMQLDADGDLVALSWESEPLSTSSVIDQVLTMNPVLLILGTDRSTQQPYSYLYRDSEVTITAIPEPSALALGGVVGLATVVRRRR